jgi:4-amino-4-deoxy-L-arabinose transferase-like glycosyltransferase
MQNPPPLEVCHAPCMDRLAGPRQGFVVAVLAALVLLPNLGGPPLWDDDEPRNAACSLAMHASGDWIVPTFNGRLRVEKPALVNWVHLAGFAIAGPNELGARLGSAVLTIGTCLLTWQIGRELFRGQAGLWAGIVMSTCLWTGVAGRAATPDAPLLFLTTLTLWLFIRGVRQTAADGGGWRSGAGRLSARAAICVGGCCGLAVLAKGPVGLVLPLVACAGFTWWQAVREPVRPGGLVTRGIAAGFETAVALRLWLLVVTALAVAAPWYLLVTLRTDGAWLEGFLLVHNVGRFTATMEGHDGSPFFYYPLVILVGMFPWSMASGLIGHHAVRGMLTADATDDRAVGIRLMAAWIVAWVVPFSLAATKLPGYVWPAYPAVAVLTGLFLADWIRLPAPTTDRWMRVAWGFLAVSGAALMLAVPLVARRLAPGAEWLGLVGCVPLCGAGAAWILQSRQARFAAGAALSATACMTVALLVAAGPACLAAGGSTRQLLAGFQNGAAGAGMPLAACFTPPSVVFYGGQLTADGTVAELNHPVEAAAFVAAHPGAHLVVDGRFEPQFRAALPATYAVVRETVALPESRRLLLLGPAHPSAGTATADTLRLAADRGDQAGR